MPPPGKWTAVGITPDTGKIWHPGHTPLLPGLKMEAGRVAAAKGELEPKWVRRTCSYIILRTCMMNVLLYPFCSLPNKQGYATHNIYMNIMLLYLIIHSGEFSRDAQT